MSDGNTSSAMFYIGGNANGSRITGSFNNPADITAADSNGIARATACVEVYATLATINHNYVVERLNVKCATTANIYVHGYTYLGSFNGIYSSASPSGFLVSTVAPSSGIGPIAFYNCYALVCVNGFELMGSSYTLDQVSTDNCNIGFYFLNDSQSTIRSWSCENTIEPMYLLNSKTSIDNFFISTAGTEASVTANTYSGQTGPATNPSILNIFSTQAADLILENGRLNVVTADFNKVIYDAAPTGHAGESNTRVSLNKVNKYGVYPKESLFGPNSYPNSITAYNNYFRLLDFDNAYPQTWTPTITVTGGSASLTIVTANYYKLGQSVYFQAEFTLTSVSTGTTVSIGGLPYTSVMSTPISIRADGLTSGATTSIQGYVYGTGKNIILEKFSAGAASALGSVIQNNATFMISGQYLTSDY